MRADLAAFLGVAILVIVTPGPDTALTIRNALLGGRRSGVFTAGGVCTGQAVWALAAAAGVAALLRASEPAFVALKLMGAAYLVFLGARALVHAYRAAEISGAVRRRPARSRRSRLTKTSRSTSRSSSLPWSMPSRSSRSTPAGPRRSSSATRA